MTIEKIVKNIQMATALGYPLSSEETKFLDAALQLYLITIDHHAAHENTGMTPDEIVKMGLAWADSNRYSGQLELKLKAYQELGPIDHLHELVQAEQDGRLVVLPCKVGDTVYVIGECRAVECLVNEAYLDDKKGIEYLVSFNCNNDCNGCPFGNWRQDYSGEYYCDGEYGLESIRGANFGKTVFLTREEAEAASMGSTRRAQRCF